MTKSIEITQDALTVAKAYMDLPANERKAFRAAIVERAAAWDTAALLGNKFPSAWPVIVMVRQDPRV